MSDELHRDAIDDELARRFGAPDSPGADPDVVLDAMRPRLERARMRRRASIASAVAGTAMAAVLLVLVLSGGGGGTNSVHTPPASNAPIHTLPPAPSTTDAGGSVTPDDTIVGGTNGGGSFDESHDGSTETTQPIGAEEIPATAPPTVPGTEEHTYSSPGGSIVVNFGGGVVSFAGSTAAPGYTTEIHDNEPTRVEVRFSNGVTEWRIRVDVVNGELQPEITQH